MNSRTASATEKRTTNSVCGSGFTAFRSQGLELSEPVRFGDWEHLDSYPPTALTTRYVTRQMLGQPISMEQPVYLPGNERQGVWASSVLETVFGPVPKREQETAHSRESRLSLRGDLELAVFAAGALRRAYADFRPPMTFASGERSPVIIDGRRSPQLPSMTTSPRPVR
jgi:hypothetical protein